MTAELWSCRLGLVPYGEALELQRRVRAARQDDRVPDTVLLLEHPPVYTRGRRSTPGELPMGEAWYRAQGIDIVDVDRGGRVTYHGPGQLVVYPIVRTDDVVAFVRTLERATIAALADEGIEARSRSDEGRDFTGVWVGQRKIGSIGLHVARGVTTHGLAVNADNDLQPFGWVTPCGLADVQMTSIAREVGPARPARPGGTLPCFAKRLAHRLAESCDRRQRLVTRARLERELATTTATALA